LEWSKSKSIFIKKLKNNQKGKTWKSKRVKACIY